MFIAEAFGTICTAIAFLLSHIQTCGELHGPDGTAPRASRLEDESIMNHEGFGEEVIYGTYCPTSTFFSSYITPVHPYPGSTGIRPQTMTGWRLLHLLF